jgi:hypothetical protein
MATFSLFGEVVGHLDRRPMKEKSNATGWRCAHRRKKIRKSSEEAGLWNSAAVERPETSFTDLPTTISS